MDFAGSARESRKLRKRIMQEKGYIDMEQDLAALYRVASTTARGGIYTGDSE